MPQLLGQWQRLLDDVPAYLSLVLQYVATLALLLFLSLWYCISVLLAVCNTCFLCSGPGGVASPVPLIFFVYFPLVAADGGVVWIGIGSFCSLFLDSSSGSTLGGGAVWFSTPGSLVLFFVSTSGGVGSASLFGILVSASKIWDSSPMLWVRRTLLEKVILAWVFTRTFPDMKQHGWPYLLKCS